MKQEAKIRDLMKSLYKADLILMSLKERLPVQAALNFPTAKLKNNIRLDVIQWKL